MPPDQASPHELSGIGCRWRAFRPEWRNSSSLNAQNGSGSQSRLAACFKCCLDLHCDPHCRPICTKLNLPKQSSSSGSAPGWACDPSSNGPPNVEPCLTFPTTQAAHAGNPESGGDQQSAIGMRTMARLICRIDQPDLILGLLSALGMLVLRAKRSRENDVGAFTNASLLGQVEHGLRIDASHDTAELK